ncbi:MAG: glycoside hydrolase family 65 protein, partial [Thermoleophilia bacterium]|nr:glycoside hydrolase family 65 protein [Thermoleophilia bacterium]
LWEVEAVGQAVRVVVQSEMVANELLPEILAGDPRARGRSGGPLRSESFARERERVVCVHTTMHSGLCMAAAMDHDIDAPSGARIGTESSADLGRVTVSADLEPGECLRVVKFMSYEWSARRSASAVRAQVDAALDNAGQTGWEGLAAAQRGFLDDFWGRADVRLEGDDQLQQAVRFALFHILQAGARAEGRAIPAKGLTGPGYDGHAFWDTEAYVLPVLTYTMPSAVADALRWRHATLDLAQERATLLGLEGAAFPWRTIRGHECSGYWPAGTAAFHVSADIAAAVSRYDAATGDEAFASTIGTDLLVETARLWMSVGHHDPLGCFRIDGVTGPDEYTAVVDNNIYTNLMAQRNLHDAAAAAERWPDRARDLGVRSGEAGAWRGAAEHMTVPYDADLGVHPQSEGFTRHARWDFAGTRPEEYPLLLHFPYFQLYRKQVLKQADVVLALHVCGDAFTPEEKLRDFEYYEPLTVRDSSLSACTQAVLAAEVGHLDLAFDYLGETALLDLNDIGHNTRDGIHIASLAGTWIGLVSGFGGMRDHGGLLSFAPRLPSALRRLEFGLTVRGGLLGVRVDHSEAVYSLRAGSPLEISHHGERLVVEGGRPVTRAIPVIPPRIPPAQAPGRAPFRRHPPFARV